MTPITFIDFCERVLSITFEPGQRVFWRVAADRVQPFELNPEEREIASELFGAEVDEIPAECFAHVAVVKGADVGFSFLGGLRLLHRALTATELGAPGEIRPALAVAPDLRLGRLPVRNALGAAESVPAIARLIENKGTDGFVIRREGGRKTSVECLPATVGGRALRGRRYLEVLFDEAAFFRDSGYAVNDVDCRRAVITRCLGTFWNGSTPWLETSDVWKTFEANYNNPVNALAARMPTLLVRTDPRVVDLVESETERDPEGADTEFRCKPPAGSGGFYFDGYAVNECQDPKLPLVLPHDGVEAFAGYDPAYSRDSAALVVVHRRGDDFVVAEVLEQRPGRGEPLVPSQTDLAAARVAQKHGARTFASDVHYAESVKEHVRGVGLSFKEAPGGNAGKAEMYAVARELVHSGRLRWSAGHKKLTQQMRDIVAKPLPGGLISIQSPRRKGAHGDIASALCLALWSARRPQFDLRQWMDDWGYSTSPDPGPIVPAYRDPVLDERAKEKLKYHNSLTRKV